MKATIEVPADAQRIMTNAGLRRCEMPKAYAAFLTAQIRDNARDAHVAFADWLYENKTKQNEYGKVKED